MDEVKSSVITKHHHIFAGEYAERGLVTEQLNTVHMTTVITIRRVMEDMWATRYNPGSKKEATKTQTYAYSSDQPLKESLMPSRLMSVLVI